MTTNLKNFLFRMVCGFFLGVSIIAPGVSGSAMAVMMGIYRELIDIVANPFKGFRRNFFYLLPLGLGALISIAALIRLLAAAFERQPAGLHLLFVGLILGGLVEIVGQMRAIPFKKRYLLGAVLALGLAVGLGLLSRGELDAHAGQPALWHLCLAGGVGGIISLVPGLSVSLMLMFFGVYDYMLQVASGFASEPLGFLAVAVPVGLCFVGGMVVFSNLTRRLFDRHPGFAYAMVLGFMAGTLFAVMPRELPQTAPQWALGLTLFAAGLAVSVGLRAIGRRMRREEP